MSEGLLGMLEERRAELRRFLVARTGSEAEADDVLSELWIRVRSSHPGPVSNPKSYLFKMANNLVLDRLREARRRERRESDWTTEQHGSHSPATDVPDPDSGAEQELIERDEAAQLAKAIAQLPAGAQRVLRLHKFEELSHGEVAERLGVSKSAVEKHMAVAMAHLRRLLGAEVSADRRRPGDNKGSPRNKATDMEP